MQVADFLQDDTTMHTAGRQFCNLLLPPGSLCTVEGPAVASDEAVAMLLDARPELAECMLLSECSGLISLKHWLAVLPDSCLPLALSAELSKHKCHLELHAFGLCSPFHGARGAQRLTEALQAVQGRVLSVRVWGEAGHWIAELLAPLQSLSSLHVLESTCHALPPLPALTHLSLSHCGALYTQGLGQLTTLKVRLLPAAAPCGNT